MPGTPVNISIYFIGWYEMTKSRRLLGQEQTGPIKGGGSSLIGKPKNKPYDDPCCHNYYHPWSEGNTNN